MQWYKHYLGDYARDTASLSLLEHGAYRLLLDAYYAHEGKLPQDKNALYRICRVRNQHEKAAVETILSQFFNWHTDSVASCDTGHNNRADKEILKYQAQCLADRKSVV